MEHTASGVGILKPGCQLSFIALRALHCTPSSRLLLLSSVVDYQTIGDGRVEMIKIIPVDVETSQEVSDRKGSGATVSREPYSQRKFECYPLNNGLASECH
ncbi:MAG: hypothetical protein Q9187_000200 [Circinaria calcarea]